MKEPFASERRVNHARKPRSCRACNRPIKEGQPRIDVTGVTSGAFETYHVHASCRGVTRSTRNLLEWCRDSDVRPDLTRDGRAA